MTASRPCRVVELRQYQLHPGRREELIALFDTYLVEPQELAGMHVIGQFRDLDRPDRFVWFRGFPSVAARAPALTRFYVEGEAWARHRDAANATMVDSDDVLQLRPVSGAPILCRAGGPEADSRDEADGVQVTILPLAAPADAARVWADVKPALAGVPVLGVLATEPAANEFPRLPVREDAAVLVLVTRRLPAPVDPDAVVLTLAPTTRSALR
jgi:hypothetical protein